MSYDSDMSASFQSFEVARNMLEDIRTSAMQAMQSLPPPRLIVSTPQSPGAETKLSLDLICNSLGIRLKQWSSAFDSLLRSRRDDITEDEKNGVQILKLSHILTCIIFNTDFVRAMSDEMLWDDYTDQFETMVGYAEDLLKSVKDQTQPAFMMEIEIIYPLYVVAAKCRHGRVRRKAISLLRSQQRQEGVWNSLLTARVAELLMQIEEEGLDGPIVSAAEVVRYKRVLGIELTFDLEERRANVSFVKLKENGGIDRLNEWLTWDSLVPKIL